ncbi:MAG: hypothetical protein IJB31_01540 [Akkermansia sp.]|nr:hypothetical protein [Akkermansia sp.]
MSIRFSSHLKQLPPWFDNHGPEDGVIVGTMGRLVRNLKGEVFPGWSTAESRKRVAEKLIPVVRSIPGFKQATHAEMTELSKEERKLLLERKQITPCLAARQDGCHVFINKKQDTIIMLNEEEHLAAHHFAAGNKLKSIVTDLRKKAQLIDKQAEIAYNKEYGYLTSMTAECGDGIQLYMVLHLPGHAMLNQIDKLERALNKMHLNLSPFYSEYGEETSNLYVLFSTPTPSGSTDDILGHMSNIAENLVEKEHLLRNKISAEDFLHLSDIIGRTYGMLLYGRMMGYPEMLYTVSQLRLALNLEFLECERGESSLLTLLNNLLLMAAPTHLAYTAEEPSPQLQKVLRMHLMSRVANAISLNDDLSQISFPKE